MNVSSPNPKHQKKDQRKNIHRTKVTTKQENTCIMHNHQLKGMNHLTNKTTTYKELMPTKNHKALNRRDQSTKRLTPHTYTKGSRRRRKATYGRENGSQPQRNQSSSLRQEIIFQAHKTYTKENTIQTWSGKHGEMESHRRRSQR